MGMLLEGRWTDQNLRQMDPKGAFIRPDSAFRNQITADGSSGFKAEPGRYHLFIAWGCPWAHRALIYRRIKDLDDVISVTYADLPKDEGWSFSKGIGGDLEPVDGVFRLYRAYTSVKPDYTGSVTVPLLWDKKERIIVNNESSEIIRMLNSALNAFGNDKDFYPEPLRSDIDALNQITYDGLNNGVYRAGFATSQEAYEAAARKVFDTLDYLEQQLDQCRYLLTDNEPTEADWRVLPTLVRFDVAYHGAFKCNLRRLEDYPNLSNYTRDLCQYPGVMDLIRPEEYKRNYYSLPRVNHTGIYPIGPELEVNFARPHNRASRSYSQPVAAN